MELFEKFALFVVIALNNKQEECSSQGKVAVRSMVLVTMNAFLDDI